MTHAIDILSGHFTEDNIRRNFHENEEELSRFAQVGRARQLTHYSAPDFIRRMDDLGIDKVLIASLFTWSFFNQKPLERTFPQEVIEVSDLYPKRLYGLYGVNPMTATKGVREFEALVIEGGQVMLTGIGTLNDGQEVTFTVEITALGDPERPDTFYIHIPALDGYESGGSLTGGHITIH